MKVVLVWLVMLLCLVSCKKEPNNSCDFVDKSSVEAHQGSGGMTGGGGDPSLTVTKEGVLGVVSGEVAPKKDVVTNQSQKLIKTGRLSFQVKSFGKAKQEIHGLIPQFGAYISSENETNYENDQQSVIQIRVPIEKFDPLVEAISKSSNQFDEKVISVEDVGEEFADVSARMAAKKQVETRYIAILGKANKISEILEIEQKIGEVRAEIESMQGRLNYLQSQVSYSTITVTFYERHSTPIAQRENFFSRIFSSFANGWQGLLDWVVDMTSIWPFVLFVVIIIGLIRKAIGKRKSKIEKKKV